MTRTRSSRSISSAMAARTASIIRNSPTGLAPAHCIDWRRGEASPPSWRCLISFSADVKNEMAGLLPARPCCQLSELLGIYFGARGRLLKRNGNGQAAYFSLLRNAVARKVVRLGRTVGHMETNYLTVKTKKLKAIVIELILTPGIYPSLQ